MARRKSAHAAVDQLRQDMADERGKARDAGVALDAAKVKVDECGRAVTDAYALEDAKLAAHRRKELRAAEAAVIDLQHRVDAAQLRVERAQQEFDVFQRDRARDLLAEREAPARTVAAELTASVHETLKLARAYLAERQAQHQLVASVPGATPRADGPEDMHPWEPALHQLARAYQQTPQLEPPLPRWQGLKHRAAQDNSLVVSSFSDASD